MCPFRLSLNSVIKRLITIRQPGSGIDHFRNAAWIEPSRTLEVHSFSDRRRLPRSLSSSRYGHSSWPCTDVCCNRGDGAFRHRVQPRRCFFQQAIKPVKIFRGGFLCSFMFCNFRAWTRSFFNRCWQYQHCLVFNHHVQKALPAAMLRRISATTLLT